MTTCNSCGGNLKPLAKFCSQCGAKDGDSANAVGTGSAASAARRFQVSASARTAIGSALFVLPSHFVGELTRLLDQHVASPLAMVADADPAQLQIKARQAFKRHHATGSLKYVCLLGNWSEVPPFRVADPMPPGYSEIVCPTDSLYGCTEEYDEDNILTAIPSVPVGRIPVLDADVVAAALLEAPRQLDPAQAFAFGVSAKCWSLPTQAIIRLFTDTTSKATLVVEPHNSALTAPGVLSSPGWAEDDLRQAVSLSQIAPGAVLLFNVHGHPDETGWSGEGEDGYVPIMDPFTIGQFNSAVMISEACYGGAMHYDEPSIVERFFTNGGKAFVGSSVSAYGAINNKWDGDEKLCNADLIALHFLKALRQGKTMGEALTLAKLETQINDPRLAATAKKSALSFNLYGAPWHSLKKAAAATVMPESENRGSMLDRIRSRRSGDVEDPSDSMADLRQRYRSKLPENYRRFMLERNDALRRISGFQDLNVVEALLADWDVSLEDCDLESIDMGDDFGFVLIGESNKHSGPKQLFQMVMDSAGAVKKILTSKGRP